MEKKNYLFGVTPPGRCYPVLRYLHIIHNSSCLTWKVHSYTTSQVLYQQGQESYIRTRLHERPSSWLVLNKNNNFFLMPHVDGHFVLLELHRALQLPSLGPVWRIRSGLDWIRIRPLRTDRIQNPVQIRNRSKTRSGSIFSCSQIN